MAKKEAKSTEAEAGTTDKQSSRGPRKGIRTVRLVAAWLFETEPDLSDAEIEAIVDRYDYPGDKLARQEMSRLRTLFNQGKLPPPVSDPRDW